MADNVGANARPLLSELVQKIENAEEEIDAINEEKKEIYAQAKSVGFCKKTIRKVIMRRKKDAAELEEEDQLVLMYENALKEEASKKT